MLSLKKAVPHYFRLLVFRSDMRLLLLSLLVCLALSRAQGPIAAGTYGLASEFGFSNSSAFNSIAASAVIVTQGVFEVNEASTTATASMMLTDNSGNEERLTVLFDVGYITDGSITLSPTQCLTSGGTLGFDLCTAARASNGCSRTYNWGQSTVNNPFANKTIILLEAFCGATGVVAFTCGTAGACNAVPANTLALPNGDYELYGLVGDFIYGTSVSSAITLLNASLSTQNNFEYVAIYNFVTSTGDSMVVKTFAVAVPDQNSNLLFSIYNCSQSQSTDTDICTLLENNGGCEVTVTDAQMDLNPPNNLTVIQLPLWCNFFGVTQFRCSSTCEGPVVRASSPATVGFQAGNCLVFNGDILNVEQNGCSLQSLTIDQLNVTNANIQNQVITNQTIVEQTVVNQTVIKQTVVNQNTLNGNFSEITSNDIFTITFTATNINVDTGFIYNLTNEYLYTNNLIVAGVPLFYEAISVSSSFLSFLSFVSTGIFTLCGTQANTQAQNPYSIYIQRIGFQVMGTIINESPTTPYINPQWTVQNTVGCPYFGLQTTNLPSRYRPTQYALQTTTAGLSLMDLNPANPCYCTLQGYITNGGTLYWAAAKSTAGTSCCTGDNGSGFSPTSGPYTGFAHSPSIPYQEMITFSYLMV